MDKLQTCAAIASFALRYLYWGLYQQRSPLVRRLFGSRTSGASFPANRIYASSTGSGSQYRPTLGIAVLSWRT